ncbi:MAG: hypothetical protein AB8B64_05915 [Granulosicoccus sp.]
MHAIIFDYYQNSEVEDFGLASTATLIRDARSEARNNLLIDKSDLIQGNIQWVTTQSDANWGFTPVNNEVQIVFDTAPDAVNASNGRNFEYLEQLENGFARYRIFMNKHSTPEQFIAINLRLTNESR